MNIKNKIDKIGVPLKDWDIQINYGIKTGCNEAFIINNEKREEILLNCLTEEERKITAEIIRPILRGRDIQRFDFHWAGLYLIATFPSRHYDINHLPALKAHLLSFGIEKLEQTGCEHLVKGKKIKARKKTNNKWFETQDSISYWEDFLKPKIVWPRLMRISKTQDNTFPRFAYVEKEMFTVDSLCFFTGKDLELLCEVLNSDYAAYYFLKNVATLDSGGVQMRQQYVEHIPIPPLEKGKNVFDAFCFTKEEVRFIKDTVTELIAIAQSN